jgi:two-component system nitrogen regulation response regulator NtrX
MTKEAQKAFLNYAWPGNVSELMNVIERFVIMVEDEAIDVAHLNLLVETREQEQTPGLQPFPSLGQATRSFERKFILRTLLKNNWDMPKTAAELDIRPDALKDKIKAYQITFLD